MKKYIAKNLLLRLLSPLTLAILCVIEAARGTFSAQALCANLLAASSLLLFCPLSFEIVGRSLPYAFGQAAVFVMVVCSRFFSGNECVLLTVSCVPGLLCYTVMRTLEKYGNVKVLFRVDAIWCSVEDYSRMVYMSVLGMIGVSVLTACRYEAPAWVFFIFVFILSAYMAIGYLRAWSGRTFLIGLEREKTIKRVIQGNLRSVPEYGGPDDHMNQVYGKVLRLMETRKPYLDPDYTLDDLAEAVFSNKVYLSKAINYYSGRNFRQFVNYYRVMYSTELMKKDYRMRVTDLALKCGFHSVVSFNMAFKLYMNMTPSAYYGILASRQKSAVKAGA